jgi:hypothetical protein
MKKLLGKMIGGFAVALLVLTGALVFDDTAQATPDRASLLAPVGTAFTYQGFITDDGNPADGSYNLRFRLYDSETGVTQVGSTVTKSSVDVSDGYFTVELDFEAVFDGTALWLEIDVQGPGDSSYTTLDPRQALNAAPFALYALNIPDHNHFGETWSGTETYGLRVVNNGTSGDRYGLRGESSSSSGYGVYGYSNASSGGTGVLGRSQNSPDGRGVYGEGQYGVYGETFDSDGYALYGEAMGSTGTNYGVYGESSSGNGYGGYFVNNHSAGTALYATGLGYGVYGVSNLSSGYGGYFANSGSDGTALYATGSGLGASKATLRVNNTEPAGGITTYMTNDSLYATAHFFNGGIGEVLYLQNGGENTWGANGGDFITAVNEDRDDVQFRVDTGGHVYSDSGYSCGSSINDSVLTTLPPGAVVYALDEDAIDPCLEDDAPADFAEMFPAKGSLGPGDVLVIGPDGDLIQSSEPYQKTVAGVYSFQPSYLGNAQFAGEDGYVPLGLLGVVPVKASAENGAIQPGDLLVTSSIPGHAMKADENPPQGTVIGKALEPLAEDTGYIRMIVTLQ